MARKPTLRLAKAKGITAGTINDLYKALTGTPMTVAELSYAKRKLGNG